MGECADALRELRGIADRLNALHDSAPNEDLEHEQKRVVRLIQSSPCEALMALAPHVRHARPDELLPAWQAMVVNGLEPTEPTLTKVAVIRSQMSAPPRTISTNEITVSRAGVQTGAPINLWVDHARQVVAVLIRRVEDGDAAKKKLPVPKTWAMEAWKASQLGMTGTAIAATLAKKYHDPSITQPRVSEQIQLAKLNAELSGLAADAAKALPHVGIRAPARTMDPAAADLGARTDGKAHHLRERERQKAKDGDDDEDHEG